MLTYGDPRLPSHFWANVQEDPSGCWLWTGSLTPSGRGRTRIGAAGDGKIFAYVLTYTALVGPVPPGMELDHTCHVRACVLPAHLQPVTHKQNGENRAGANRNSLTGVRGVGRRGNRYIVRVRHRGAIYRGGTFSTLDEAENAARSLRTELFSNNLLDRRVS